MTHEFTSWDLLALEELVSRRKAKLLKDHPSCSTDVRNPAWVLYRNMTELEGKLNKLDGVE